MKIKEGALEKAKADLERCTIRSPIDGIVISRNVDVGQTVAASLQAPVLFTIANDLTKMQIDANVAEADVGAVAVDQDVEFTVDAFPNRTFRARSRRCATRPPRCKTWSPTTPSSASTIPELKLKPGMTANVSIVIAQRDDVLKVPNAALAFPTAGRDRRPQRAARRSPARAARRTAGGRDAARAQRRIERTVYVLPHGAAKPQPVQIKIGISDGVTTEVLEGLKEGDRVVTGRGVRRHRSGHAARRRTIPFGGGCGGRRF